MGHPLRVVLVHRYFDPDTPPYGHMLRAIADSLASEGHEVRVLTCQPSYRREVVRRAGRHESLGLVSVRRFGVLDDRSSHAAKVVNMLWFCLRIALSRSAFRGADVVMAATTPPVAVAGVCSALARAHGAKFVYHKQDVWPEVSGHGGIARRVLRRLDHKTETSAARVVVLSADMAATIAARSDEPVTVEVLNNFDPWNGDNAPARKRSGWQGLSLVYAGNLGRFQGIEHLADVVRATADDKRISWHFFGDGPLRGMVQDLGDQVHYHGHRSPEEVATFLENGAHIGVVSLDPGVIRSAYPSKTMTYLRHGCPVLALVEPESELARMVVEDRIGVTGPQDDPGAVVERLRALVTDPTQLDGAAERARATYERRFGRDRQLRRWVRLMEEVAG